jgi:hypothetical protein
MDAARRVPGPYGSAIVGSERSQRNGVVTQALVARSVYRMFSGLHLLLYSTNPDADRAFLRDVLELPYVEDAPGWLIFKAPPGELAVHPTDGPPVTELHLMCDDIEATTAALTAKDVQVAEVHEERWGRATSLTLPSGATIGLYQPKHRTAYGL